MYVNYGEELRELSVWSQFVWDCDECFYLNTEEINPIGCVVKCYNCDVEFFISRAL